MTVGQVRGFILRELDLFRDLSDAEIDAIGAAAPMRTIPAGQVLYSPGRPTEVLFILKGGRVRLYMIGADGRTLTTAIVEPGQLFGEMVPLGQSLTDTYAETLDPSVAELETRLSDTVLKSAPDRIASTLARLADRDGASIRLTHEQLADLVGTTRETVTKVLGDLAARGLIQQKRGRILVTNRSGVGHLATYGGLNPIIGGSHS